jgi:hypothetical protein
MMQQQQLQQYSQAAAATSSRHQQLQQQQQRWIAVVTTRMAILQLLHMKLSVCRNLLQVPQRWSALQQQLRQALLLLCYWQCYPGQTRCGLQMPAAAAV